MQHCRRQRNVAAHLVDERCGQMKDVGAAAAAVSDDVSASGQLLARERWKHACKRTRSSGGKPARLHIAAGVHRGLYVGTVEAREEQDGWLSRQQRRSDVWLHGSRELK